MVKPDLRAIQAWVKTQVSPYRFEHIRGVAQTAKRLALRHHLPPSKALLAGWLHDCAKELSRPEMKKWLRGSPFRLDSEEQAMPGLWHPHAGAALALKKWGVRDKSVLEAIRCHTLGSPRMGPLAQVLFVADFTEPGRDFAGVEAVRRVASRDLSGAILLKASMTIDFLFKKNMRIHPRLLETWNSFLVRRKKLERSIAR